MIAKIIKALKNEKGQSVIELAITLPVLIMILSAIVDFGWLFMHQNIIDYCSRDGARYAVVHSDSTIAIKNYVLSIAPDDMSDSMEIDVTFTDPADPTEGDVIVTINSDVAVLTPIVGLFLPGDTINLDAACTMKVEE
ncbi:TadE/TadG family type IV pilus assembly protein [Eubacteriaceae bacterium ES3]|nr:TadE/TadG family type IV pilus assembly protein [Eubacteriaceae bacterium ES3]